MEKPNIVHVVIAAGIWTLVLQNAGVLPPITSAHAQSRVTDVNIVGSSATLDVNVESASTPLDVNVDSVNGTVDINLSAVVGRELVESKNGMTIGVSGQGNSIVPIHWGEIGVSR